MVTAGSGYTNYRKRKKKWPEQMNLVKVRQMQRTNNTACTSFTLYKQYTHEMVLETW